MKNKILTSALFAFIAILMVAPQAMALEIYVDDYGTVRFYQGSVLGDDDENDSSYPKNIDSARSGSGRSTNQRNSARNSYSNNKNNTRSGSGSSNSKSRGGSGSSGSSSRGGSNYTGGNTNGGSSSSGFIQKGGSTNYRNNNYNSPERIEIRQSTPVKTLNSSAKQRIEFRSEDNEDRLKVELRQINNKTKLKSESRSINEAGFEKKEEIEARSIDFSFPSDIKDARSTEDRVDYFKEKYSQRTDVKSLDEEDRDTAIEKRQEDYKLYLEKLQEERTNRSEERVEIRDRSRENGEERKFEIQSRSAKAKLNGADFSYDTDTGEVVLTTPSGQEHFLQHLPDQAIDRMTENGFFVNEGQEVEIVTTEDGQVKYKSAAKKNKRFLGFFNRQVNTEVILDDLTGEIVETEAKVGGFAGFLNSLSF